MLYYVVNMTLKNSISSCYYKQCLLILILFYFQHHYTKRHTEGKDGMHLCTLDKKGHNLQKDTRLTSQSGGAKKGI